MWNVSKILNILDCHDNHGDQNNQDNHKGKVDAFTFKPKKLSELH